MTLQELRKHDANGLKEELLALRHTQLKLTMQKSSARLEQTHHIRQVRRDIARVKTLLREQNIKV
ncbi:MAG: 50S ribosomal protein L29 [Cardiobacteriaceae bacterium]|nr:50S ribosomal protein L29 [Cardiobacteriaceae bacterium]